MYIYYCNFCNKTYNFVKRNQPRAHKINCDLNPNKLSIRNKAKKTLGCLSKERDLNCLKCNIAYKLNVSDKLFNRGKYRKYCSLKCANSRIWTETDKYKKFIAFIKKESIEKSIEILIEDTRECKICKNEFKCNITSNRKFCSKKCISSYAGRKSAKVNIKRSKQEIQLFELIRTIQPKVKNNFIIAKDWDADIVLEDEKIAIFWNGPWHYREMNFKNHSLLQVQNRDKIKKKLFENLGWSVFIFEDRHYTSEEAFKTITPYVPANKSSS
jgi:hypothetical protein